MPSGPKAAKGLLLKVRGNLPKFCHGCFLTDIQSIRSKDSVIFLEPKALYRAAVEDVPVYDYKCRFYYQMKESLSILEFFTIVVVV
jgi:hypothetical protein